MTNIALATAFGMAVGFVIGFCAARIFPHKASRDAGGRFTSSRDDSNSGV